MWFFVSTVLMVAALTQGAPQFSTPTATAYQQTQQGQGQVSQFQGTGQSQSQTTPISILTQNEENNADGSFNYEFETSNGIKQQASGFLKKVIVARFDGDGKSANEGPGEEEVIVQTGSYSYTDPEGKIITLT